MYSNPHQLIPPPVLCICVWGMLALFTLSLWRALQTGITRLYQLHQIPCNRCLYSTREYRLKCTVKPYTAFTEEAVGCSDFSPLAPSCALHSYPIRRPVACPPCSPYRQPQP